jgi:hypothetical protein
MRNQQPRQRLPPQTPSRQTLSNQLNMKRPKVKRISSRIRMKRSKQSLKMKWHASIRKMSAYGSCRNKWPEEKRWRKEPKLYSSRSSKKEQLRQSCSEQLNTSTIEKGSVNARAFVAVVSSATTPSAKYISPVKK